MSVSYQWVTDHWFVLEAGTDPRKDSVMQKERPL